MIKPTKQSSTEGAASGEATQSSTEGAASGEATQSSTEGAASGEATQSSTEGAASGEATQSSTEGAGTPSLSEAARQEAEDLISPSAKTVRDLEYAMTDLEKELEAHKRILEHLCGRLGVNPADLLKE